MATKEFTWKNSKDEFESKNLIGLDLETTGINRNIEYERPTSAAADVGLSYSIFRLIPVVSRSKPIRFLDSNSSFEFFQVNSFVAIFTPIYQNN